MLTLKKSDGAADMAGAWELEVLNKAGRVDQGDRVSLLRFGRYM